MKETSIEEKKGSFIADTKNCVWECVCVTLLRHVWRCDVTVDEFLKYYWGKVIPQLLSKKFDYKFKTFL